MIFNYILSIEKNAEIGKEYDKLAYDVGQALAYLKKEASVKTHALSGELYASSDNSILLSVPNALVRGAFDAIDEPGLTLPGKHGKFNAHIVVMTPSEVKKAGGVAKVTERGHHFHYSLGALQEAPAPSMFDFSKVWFLVVASPELSQLRKTYGLEPTPSKTGFNIVVALRRIGVLGKNDINKHASAQLLRDILGNKHKSKVEQMIGHIKYMSKLQGENKAPELKRQESLAERLEALVGGFEPDQSFGSNFSTMLG